jgi:hypothetical protein
MKLTWLMITIVNEGGGEKIDERGIWFFLFFSFNLTSIPRLERSI